MVFTGEFDVVLTAAGFKGVLLTGLGFFDGVSSSPGPKVVPL